MRGSFAACALALSGSWMTFAASAGAPDPKTWPPEPLIEMRVPFEPVAYPNDGRAYLTYELRLTNLETQPMALKRLEVFDADNLAAGPVAAFEADRLDGVLQHFANPAVGDRMAIAGDSHRTLASGETAIVFLTLAIGPGARVPGRLSHRLQLADGKVEGATVGTHGIKLRTLGPPLEGASWQAYSGAGDNVSHHRRQIYVLGGRASMPNRYAIDWVRTKEGARYSGEKGDNRSYYSHDQPVLAVADGTIVKATDGVPNNSPGHVGAEALGFTLDTFAGNTIVLDLGGGQFAHYMHLEPGSLRVKTGDRVRRGQRLARVGNTGSSFEPHLHFEVTTSPNTIAGEGLPYLISEYRQIPKAGDAAAEPATGARRRELPVAGAAIDFGMPRKR